MAQREPRGLGDGVLARHEHAVAERRVGRVLDVAADRLHRHVIQVGVEVAAHGQQRVGVVVEELVDEHPGLERLAYALERRHEEALGPARGGAPGVLVDPLAGDRRGQLGLEVHVDDVQRPPAAEVEHRVNDRPLPAHAGRARGWRDRGGRPVLRRGHEVLRELPALDDREPAQDHEIADVVERGVARARRHAMEARVLRPAEHLLERAQRARAVRRRLAVDLLQAQHVRAQPHERRAQHGRADGERRLVARVVVEVRGRDAQTHAVLPCGDESPSQVNQRAGRATRRASLRSRSSGVRAKLPQNDDSHAARTLSREDAALLARRP